MSSAGGVQRRLVRLHPRCPTWCRAIPTCSPPCARCIIWLVLDADRRAGAARRRRGASRCAAPRRHLPPHVAVHEVAVRALLSVLVLSSPHRRWRDRPIPGRSIRAQEPHRLHRRAARQAAVGPHRHMDRHDRARAGRPCRRPHRHPHEHARPPPPAPGMSTTSCWVPTSSMSSMQPRPASPAPRSAERRQRLRGTGQAHDPRRHARRHPALQPEDPGRPRNGARAAHHQAAGLRRRPQRMGRHQLRRQRRHDRHHGRGVEANDRAAPALRRRRLAPPGPGARAQSGLWPEWLGSYSGAVRFYRSIPLEDIYPPPEHPHVDLEDPAPFAVYFSIRAEDGIAVVWLRIDGGPMQTTYEGETLRFGPLTNGFAALIGAQARPAPRSASLTVRPDFARHRGAVQPCRRQLLAPPLQRPLHAGRRRRDRLGVRRRRHAGPHVARVGNARRLKRPLSQAEFGRYPRQRDAMRIRPGGRLAIGGQQKAPRREAIGLVLPIGEAAIDPRRRCQSRGFVVHAHRRFG